MEDSPLKDIRIGQVTSRWAENNHLFAHYEASTTSTSDLAKTRAFADEMEKEPLALFLADHQTAGRGRGKNTWIDSREGSCLLSSWSYMTAAKPQPTTSCLVGLSVFRALSTTWPFLNWSLKAPNDVYIDDKKVVGILMESVLEGAKVRVIVGLGINVLGSPETVPTAGSILQSLPPGVPLLGQDWTAFLDRLLFEMSDAISHCEDPLTPSDRQSLLSALNRHPLLKEKYQDIDPQGSLRTLSGKTLNWWEL